MEQSQNHPEIQYAVDEKGETWVKLPAGSKLKLLAMEQTMIETLVSSRNNETLTYHRTRYNKLTGEGKTFNPGDIRDPFFIDGKRFYIVNADVKANETNDLLVVSEKMYNNRVYAATRRKRAKDAKEVAKIYAVEPMFKLPEPGTMVQLPPPTPSKPPKTLSFVIPSIGTPVAVEPTTALPIVFNTGELEPIVPTTTSFDFNKMVSNLETTPDSDEDY